MSCCMSHDDVFQDIDEDNVVMPQPVFYLLILSVEEGR